MAVVGPHTELHEAFLLIKREELDVDWAVGLVDCLWLPDNKTGAVDLCFGKQSDNKVTIRTEKQANIN
ncbi:hypothetical protein DPMN_107899 [Dreissena polymorpha]|uniref:Uncharacterized protein n=1 Tax=Dreissena polymorpha TaxID=45954 RepID=A0A9D4QKL5_DREPO|nr:hypothetical protein DPMN_107899 [Dreissena polymorpha]